MTEAMQLRDAAVHLPALERAELAAFLLSSLDENHYWEDNEEAIRRTEELNLGTVKGLSLSEFKQACGR